MFTLLVCSLLLLLLLLLQEPTDIPSRKKLMRWVCARGWCVRRGSLLQDHLPVKFNDAKFKNEIFFLRIDMKHSYFSNFCLQSIFLLLKLFCLQKLIHVYAYVLVV